MLCDLNYICSRNNIRTLLTLRRTSALVIEIVLVLLGTLKEFSLLCIYLQSLIMQLSILTFIPLVFLCAMLLLCASAQQPPTARRGWNADAFQSKGHPRAWNFRLQKCNFSSKASQTLESYGITKWNMLISGMNL